MDCKIDSLAKDTRKLKRHVAFTDTHEVKLVFLCTISKAKDQIVVVEEAKEIVSQSGKDLLKLGDELRMLKDKYRHFGCVGFLIESLGKNNKQSVFGKKKFTRNFNAGLFESEKKARVIKDLIQTMAA